ncbi:MAG: hypothetical protein ACMUHB_05485 [Thermoplasmatota archaeon]
MESNGQDRRWMWALPFAILAVILLSFATYQWAIPRTNLEIRTVYHESPGGGGTGGTLNVNVLFTNKGNREIEDLGSTITVTELGRGIRERYSLDPSNIGTGKNIEVKIAFIGSQYETYLISVSVSFVCTGDSHAQTLEYQTVEDVMNLVFVENIR